MPSNLQTSKKTIPCPVERVVDFDDTPAFVVTAFVQDQEPGLTP